MKLQNPPQINLLKQEKNTEGEPPFLKVKRGWFRLSYPNGDKSEQCLLDSIERKNYDASLIICHEVIDSARVVYLRSCIRPAISMRFSGMGNLWELPAGLIEQDETPAEAAARECLEELGFPAEAEGMKSLGEFSMTMPSILAERLYFFEYEIPYGMKRKEPSGDGHALERNAKIMPVAISNAMGAIRRGELKDMKTEIAIRRFAERMGL